MLVLASILFALSDVASKASLADVDAVSVMFGIRMVGVPLLLLGFGLWRKKIDFISPKLAGFSLTTAVLSDLAAYLFILACTFAYVSLVTAAVTSQAIFAFLGAFLIAKLNPKLLQEDTSRKSLMKKAIALALLIIGVIFVVT
jgi:drug/metabolite transporter (DMT)-like permease